MSECKDITEVPYTDILVSEIVDEGSSLINAAAKTFYKAKGELVAYTVRTYMDERFIKRIERFAKEEELLSKEQIESFYESIDETKLNILFELLDKTRTSMYELHAKVLAKIYLSYLNEGKLNQANEYFLLSISSFSKFDIERTKEILEQYVVEFSDFSRYYDKTLHVSPMVDIDIIVIEKMKTIGVVDTYSVEKIEQRATLIINFASNAEGVYKLLKSI